MKSIYRMQKNIREVLIHVLTILFLLGVIFPLFWMFLCSIKPAGIVFALPPVWKFVPTIDNYRAALVDRAIDGGQFIKGLGTSPLPRYFFNSIIVAIAVTLSNLFVGGLAGYGMARYKVGGNVLPLAFLFGRMMPPIVFLFPFFLIAKNLSLQNNPLALIMAYTAFNLPFCVWMSWSYFLDMPKEIEEAAMVDGCNAVQAVVFVVIPMAIVGLLSIGILVFVGCWNEFLFASTLAGMNMKTLPVAALMFIRDEAILWGPMTATCVIIMFIPIVITIFLQKYIVSGISLGALKG